MREEKEESTERLVQMLVDLVQMNPPYSVHRLKQPIIVVLSNTLWTALADLTLKIKNN